MLSLPNELVALILVHLSKGPEIDGSSWPLQSSSHEWLPLAQTCRRVHDVAASTQYLWQRIAIFSRAGGLDTALGRSGDLVVDVIFHQPHVIPLAFMLLAPHAARVRTLAIIKADHDTHSALRFLLARPMPALTTCQVHLVHHDIPQPRRTGEMRFTVNHALAPNLQALQLGVLSFDWKSAMVPHLRRLSLWNAFPPVFLPFDRFLDVLQSCALLEHLEIRYCPPFMTPAPPTERAVALPHLRTLVLESSDYAEVSAILSHLSLSEHVDLDINLDIDTDNEEEAVLALPDILPLDPTRLPLLASATSASFSSDGYILVEAECSAPDPAPASPPGGRLRAFLDPGSATEIDQGWRYTPSEAAAHFCSLLAHAPLRALALRLVWPYAGEASAAAGTFARVFRAFPGLDELAYAGGGDEASDRQLLDALAGDDDAVPRLRGLRLERWDAGLVPLLVEVLRARAARGLRRLSELDVRVVAGSEDTDGAVLRAVQQLVDGDVAIVR